MKRLSGVRLIAVVGLIALGLLGPVAPVSANVCGTYPGTNPIEIKIEDVTHPVIEVPGTPAGLVGVCVGFTTPGVPTVDAEPTVELGEDCGTPCFVVAWDGVAHEGITVQVTVIVDNAPTTIERTIPAGAAGGFCVNSGMPCP